MGRVKLPSGHFAYYAATVFGIYRNALATSRTASSVLPHCRVVFNPLTVTIFTTVFGNWGGAGILPPVVFRLYCPYLKNSNGATYDIKGAKFSSVVGNYVSVQLNRKFSTISGLIAILKFVAVVRHYRQYEINDVVIKHV